MGKPADTDMIFALAAGEGLSSKISNCSWFSLPVDNKAHFSWNTLAASWPYIPLNEITARSPPVTQPNHRRTHTYSKKPVTRKSHWKRLGSPTLSERAGGTVRETIRSHGTAWEYLHLTITPARAYSLERRRKSRAISRTATSASASFSVALWMCRDRDPERAPLRPHRRRHNHGRDCQYVTSFWIQLPRIPT